MALSLDEFTGFGFEAEDNAEFNVGANDLRARWASTEKCEDGSTVSGFVVRTGYSESFDHAVEAYNAAHNGAAQRVILTHDKENEEVWIFPQVSLFVICKGLKTPLEEQGIVKAWGEKGSVLSFRVILHDLIEYGYMEPIQVRSNGLGKAQMGFWKALQEQARVLAAFREQSGKKDLALPYWSFSLPIRKDKKLVDVGNGPQKSKMILPVAEIPDDISAAFLKEHFVGNTSLAEFLKEYIKGLIPETIEWARQQVLAVKSGKSSASNEEDAASTGPASYDGFQDIPDEYQEVASPAPDSLATKEQRDALTKLATKLNMPGLKTTAQKGDLSFAQAASAITEANKQLRGKVTTGK